MTFAMSSAKKEEGGSEDFRPMAWVQMPPDSPTILEAQVKRSAC